MAITVSDVKDIFDTELTDTQLQRHLDVAERFVEREIGGQDQQVKDDVALYLSAHFAATQEPRAERASVGDASVTYQGDSGMGFKSTRYGQTAIRLDPTNRLQSIAEGKQSASITFYARND